MTVRRASFAAVLALALAACDGPADAPDGGCAPGTAGCACLDETICQGGLTCDMGLCVGIVLVELEVLDANARSCEVVVVEEGTEVLGVDFATGVQGTSVHESPRTAVTFFSEGDSAFAERAVLLRRSESDAPTLRLRHARCFDRDGTALGGEPLRVGG